MSPWWLRPTADGRADEDRPEPESPGAEASPDASKTASSAAGASAPQAAEESPAAALPSAPFTSADALPEAPDDDADEDVWNAEAEDEDDEDEEDEDEETGFAESETGEAEELPGAVSADGAPARRRRRRGGRRRRGADKAPNGNAVREAAEPQREERPRREERGRRPERNEVMELPPVDFQAMTQAPQMPIYVERTHTAPDERKIALFCDLENIALGVRDSEVKKFDIHLVLERLVEKGKIIVKKAYADWERYTEYKRAARGGHRADRDPAASTTGQELGRHPPGRRRHGPLLLQGAHRHLRHRSPATRDFSPLVSKLKENDKHVIGVGMKNSTSDLLVDNCDEFIYYEDSGATRSKGPELDGPDQEEGRGLQPADRLDPGAACARTRTCSGARWSRTPCSARSPSFNEGYYGYRPSPSCSRTPSARASST